MDRLLHEQTTCIGHPLKRLGVRDMEARSNLLKKTGKSWGIGKRRDRPRIGAVRTRLLGSEVGDLSLFQRALNILVFVVGASYVLGFVTVAQIEREQQSRSSVITKRKHSESWGAVLEENWRSVPENSLSPRIPQEFPRIGVCHKVGDENVLWGPRSAQMCALDSHRVLRGNVSGATGPPFE